MLWHGWNDAGAPPEPTLDYYDEVVATTFGGDIERGARARAALHVPRHGALRRRPGTERRGIRSRRSCAWVENGTAPDSVVAPHSTDGRVDNERRVCAYPQVARYSGPAGGADDPANWVAANFTCR